MSPRRPVLYQIPAWLLVIGLLAVGSGWTFGGWSGGYSQSYNSTDIGQYNYGEGNDRDNYAEAYTSWSGGSDGCWGCYVPPPPCPPPPPPPPPPCYTCPGPEPEPTPDPEPEPTGKCKGVKSLTLKYIGDDDATVEVKHKKDNLGTFELSPGETFTLSGAGSKKGKLGADVRLKYDGKETKIHTSCSKPIEVGMIFGDFEIVALEKVYKK